MAKQLDFHDDYYLRGNNIIHIGSGYFQMPIGGDIVIDNPAGKMRFNDSRNVVQIGLNNSWITLSDLPDVSSFVSRLGDSMVGDLRMMGNAKILSSFGTNEVPSYTFFGDEDTGLYRSGDNAIGIVLGSSINNTPVINMVRTGNSSDDNDIFINGDVWVDELTFTRKDGLKLDGDYAYFTGTTGLRLPTGNTSQRHSNPLALVRYNNDLNRYDIGFGTNYPSISPTLSPWGSLSLIKDQSSWFVRSGDSVFGDLQMTNNARIMVTNGSASNPSLTFDSDKNTGFYKTTNGLSLVVESDRNTTPVIGITRTGAGNKANNVVMNATLFVDDITFDTLRLNGNYVNINSNGSLNLPIGNAAQRSNNTADIRYNSEINAFEMRTNTVWITASGRADVDTWVNRTGDSMSGDLRFTGGRVLHSNGTVASPSISFLNDTDTGITRIGADSMAFMVGSSVNPTPAMTITRHGTANDAKTITINGNLVVNGTQTTINTTELVVEDNKITLNKGNSGSSVSGIEIENNNTIVSTLQYVFASNMWTIDNSRLGMLSNPIDNNDATNKVYVDVLVQTTEDQLRSEIVAERNRAIAEEQRIEQLVVSEAQRLDGRIDDNTTAINNEVSRATGEEQRIETKVNNNTTAINNEVSRATGEEQRIEGKVDNNTTAINNEVSRATSEEQRIEGKVDNNTTAINNEVSRATSEEQRIETKVNNNTTTINNEVSRATGEEQRIEGKVDNNTTAINNEVSRATSEEQRIEGKVDNNTTAINNEVSRATGEEQRIEGKVDNNTTAINNEIIRSTNRDDQLSLQIATKQDAIGYTPENVANKGQAGGYPSLNMQGIVPDWQLPAKLYGEAGTVVYYDESGQNQSTGYILRELRLAANSAQLIEEKQSVESQEAIFNTWHRFSHGSNSQLPSQATETNQWAYNNVTDTISCLINSNTHIGFVSNQKYDTYIHEVTLSSTGGDNDMMGVVAAFAFDETDMITNGAFNLDPSSYSWDINTTDSHVPNEHTLTVIRARSAEGHMSVAGQNVQYGVVYNYLRPNAKIIAFGDALIDTVSGNFGGNSSTVRIERNGDIIEIWTTEWSDSTQYDGTLKGKITIDLTSDPVLSVFRGKQHYGYSCHSQPNSFFSNIKFTNPNNTIYDLENNQAWVYDNSVSDWVVDTSIDMVDDIGIGRFVFNPIYGELFYVNADREIKSISRAFDGSNYYTKNEIDSQQQGWTFEQVVPAQGNMSYNLNSHFPSSLDKRLLDVNIKVLDNVSGSPTNGTWIDARGVCTYSINTNTNTLNLRNEYTTALTFFVKVKL